MIRKLMVAVAVLGFAGSGAVAQGVSFSGSAGMGVKYTGDMENDAGETTMKSTINWISDFDIAISAAGTTDGGLTFGASTAIEAGHSKSVITDSEVYIGGESWSVKIGSLDPASHKGRSLGDVGYDGLGVDDVAENIKYDHDGMDSTELMGQGTKSNIEVSFSLGAASLAITAGQTDGTARKAKVDGTDAIPETYRYNIFTQSGTTPTEDTPVVSDVANRLIEFVDNKLITTEVQKSGKLSLYDESEYFMNQYIDFNDGTKDANKNKYYLNVVSTSNDNYYVFKVNGLRDSDPGKTGAVIDPAAMTDEQKEALGLDNDGNQVTIDPTDERVNISSADGAAGVEVNVHDFDNEVIAAISAIPEVPAVPAMGQKTEWAAGVSFDVGGTTLGIGMDSNKLMQASVSADLGGFSSKLFYSQQKATAAKLTGMGVEIGVPAGENTTINAVYAQGKVDYKDADNKGSTAKGFGVGVSHGLGGGATLQAGFAKVEDVTKASVGVSMSF